MRGTSASAGSAGAGNRDNTPDAQPCPYSDFHLSNRASHGDADGAAVGPSTRLGWSEADVPGGFALELPPGAAGAAANIFGQWSGGSDAGPAPVSTEATHQDESDARLNTWLANNMPPAPPQQVPGVDKGKGGGSFLLDSGSPAMSTWRPSVPKPSLPKPSTASDAWQGPTGAASSSNSSAWEQTHAPWSASSNRGWRGQGWSSWNWRDDAERPPPRAKRGSAPYPKDKGKEGKKGHDPAS